MLKRLVLSVIILLCLSGCLELNEGVCLQKGMVEDLVHFNGKTYIKFNGDKETYWCDYAPWINPGNYIEIVETKRGIECQ